MLKLEKLSHLRFTSSFSSAHCAFFLSRLNLYRTFSHLKEKYRASNRSLNRKTFLNLLNSCLIRNEPFGVKQVHCLTLKSGFLFDSHVSTALIDTYSKLGFVSNARKLFDKTPQRDVVLWNVMISCYSTNGFEIEAFLLFNSMRDSGFVGDQFTFSTLIRACNSLNHKFVQTTHSLVINLGFDKDVVVCTSLIDAYSKCDCITDARKVFDEMKGKNVISWNAMIIGYGKNHNFIDAMKLLNLMLKEGLFKLDELTFSNILSSCAHNSFSNETFQIHAFVLKSGFLPFISVTNALILAYAKNGFIKNALNIFGKISKPDLITWSCIISSCAYHGFHKHALKLFDEMLQREIKPDKIAFLGVLTACAHAGLVEVGLKYFNLMKDKYHINPSLEHYACLTDLFGRAGQLDNANYLLDEMSGGINGDILGAFMSACKEQGNFRMAQRVISKINNLEPNKLVNYTVLSNLYSDIGSWDDVARVREIMRVNFENKVPGCSWI